MKHRPDRLKACIAAFRAWSVLRLAYLDTRRAIFVYIHIVLNVAYRLIAIYTISTTQRSDLSFLIKMRLRCGPGARQRQQGAYIAAHLSPSRLSWRPVSGLRPIGRAAIDRHQAPLSAARGPRRSHSLACKAEAGSYAVPKVQRLEMQAGASEPASARSKRKIAAGRAQGHLCVQSATLKG